MPRPPATGTFKNNTGWQPSRRSMLSCRPLTATVASVTPIILDAPGQQLMKAGLDLCQSVVTGSLGRSRELQGHMHSYHHGDPDVDLAQRWAGPCPRAVDRRAPHRRFPAGRRQEPVPEVVEATTMVRGLRRCLDAVGVYFPASCSSRGIFGGSRTAVSFLATPDASVQPRAETISNKASIRRMVSRSFPLGLIAAILRRHFYLRAPKSTDGEIVVRNA